ncbi:MAG: hypothetical protein QF771_04655 [Candidatus Marinimicrobia bacterium]|nr:hypothetical protein [Candidatus Neomarinimicrobiota bacterium]
MTPNYMAATVLTIGAPILGVIIPAIILSLSFFLTYLLIKYFSRNQQEDSEE